MKRTTIPTLVWGDKKKRICSLCGQSFFGMGNNPEPLKPFDARCCDDCNAHKVIAARLAMIYGKRKGQAVADSIASASERARNEAHDNESDRKAGCFDE